MRTKHSLINICVGLGNQLIITLLSFFSRTVFIHTLGVDYLGVNGLFTNLLAMLTLAEAGIGSSIIYSLYKPVADNDIERINVLMKLYKRAYLAIAAIVLLLGLALLPFLRYFVKDAHVAHLYGIYLIFLLNTVTPYLFLHKNSFLNVCQKTYIVTGLYSVSSILSTGLKIVILYASQNYLLYLIIDSAISVTNGVILTRIANRRYPFLQHRTEARLDPETRRGILRNIKAIVLQNIGSYLVFGTDNILISSFVSVAAVGLYSNYNMLIDICRTLVNQVFNNMYHSVGNLVAKETRDKVYRVYKATMLLNFWLYSVSSIGLYVMIEPFIKLWIGPSFLMSNGVLLVLIVIFYERGMRNSISTVKTTAGIFHEDRFVPLGQAVINLSFSIVLVKTIGIAGVFLGTLISAVALPFWVTPFLAYKKVFQLPVRDYFLRYAGLLAVGLGTGAATEYACHFLLADQLGSLLIRGMIAFLLPNAIYAAVFYRTEQFQYLAGIGLGLARRLLEKKDRRLAERSV